MKILKRNKKKITKIENIRRILLWWEGSDFLPIAEGLFSLLSNGGTKRAKYRKVTPTDRVYSQRKIFGLVYVNPILHG